MPTPIGLRWLKSSAANLLNGTPVPLQVRKEVDAMNSRIATYASLLAYSAVLMWVMMSLFLPAMNLNW